MYSIHIWFTGLNFLPCGWDKVFGAPWADPDPADMRAKIKQTRRNCISCITCPFATLIQGNLFVGFLGILMSISVIRTTGSGNPMKYFWDEAVLLQIDNIFNSGMFLAQIFVTPHCLYQWLHETPDDPDNQVRQVSGIPYKFWRPPDPNIIWQYDNRYFKMWGRSGLNFFGIICQHLDWQNSKTTSFSKVLL